VADVNEGDEPVMTFDRIFGERIGRVLNGWADTIHAINKKYEKPRIKMSPGVKIALMFLRIYLILLVVLLGYKFWTMIQ
jgi:hypothetical protein